MRNGKRRKTQAEKLKTESSTNPTNKTNRTN